MDTFGFLGGGTMAEALIRGVIVNGVAAPDALWVCERLEKRREAVQKNLGVRVCALPGPVLDACNTLVLAVKPQDMDALLDAIAGRLSSRHLLISIAAGKTLPAIRASLSDGVPARIARVMPNLALQAGAGMSVYCLERTDGEGAGDAKLIERLFGCAGRVITLPEAQFDVVTALSGSGPAFLAFVLSAMAESAHAQGLRAEDALLLAVQTMLGTAKVLGSGDISPRDFIRSVTSPNGTTAAGMAVLEKSGLSAVLDATLRAAAQRGRELSRL